MKAIKTKQEIKKEEFDRYMDKEYGHEAIKKDILKQIYQNKKNKKDPYDGMSTASIMVAEIIKDKAKSQLAAMKEPSIARQVREPSIARQVINYIPNKIDVEEILDKYEDGFESKKNIKVAMSETPKEEADLLLGIESKQFMQWLKKNKNKTYNDWLKDKKAILTEEQKKDKKIIDLTPFLPSFEEELKRMEEKEKEKETLEDFINRRSREIKLSERDNAGIPQLLAMKN
ncbi:MAG: hypothetical protein HN624_00015 [Flavobacteriaceae bacterium]|jgi:hypothetical protein|nr:hypothetical protein [Flavobacteriaceae bacterium]